MASLDPRPAHRLLTDAEAAARGFAPELHPGSAILLTGQPAPRKRHWWQRQEPDRNGVWQYVGDGVEHPRKPYAVVDLAARRAEEDDEEEATICLRELISAVAAVGLTVGGLVIWGIWW